MQNDRSNGELEALFEQLDRVRSDRARLEARIGKLREKLAQLATLEIELGNSINVSRANSSDCAAPSNSAPNAKTIRVWQAWAALHNAMARIGEGSIPHSQAVRSIASALPGTPDATIRSYLHRFKTRGLIIKRQGTWYLQESAHPAQPVDVERCI